MEEGGIPCVAQVVLRRDKGDKEDKGDSSHKKNIFAINGMLPLKKPRCRGSIPLL